jgi:hypothetical protein
MNKNILPILLTGILSVFAVIAIAGCGKNNKSEDMVLWTISGRYCETTDGKRLLLSDTEGAICLSVASEGDMFADLENGDEIEIAVDGVAETYPAQATVYECTLIQKGTVDDLDMEELQALSDLGWEFSFAMGVTNEADSGLEENMESNFADTEEETIHDGVDMDNPPINWGTPDGPETAAENYYKDTVFELVSLEVLQSSTEYVKFSVVSKKDGEIVEPNRTIELRYENETWNVIGEGY